MYLHNKLQPHRSEVLGMLGSVNQLSATGWTASVWAAVQSWRQLNQKSWKQSACSMQDCADK